MIGFSSFLLESGAPRGSLTNLRWRRRWHRRWPGPSVLSRQVHMSDSGQFSLESDHDARFFRDWSEVFYDLVAFRAWYEGKEGPFPKSRLQVELRETYGPCHFFDFAARKLFGHPGLCFGWRSGRPPVLEFETDLSPENLAEVLCAIGSHFQGRRRGPSGPNEATLWWPREQEVLREIVTDLLTDYHGGFGEAVECGRQ